MSGGGTCPASGGGAAAACTASALSTCVQVDLRLRAGEHMLEHLSRLVLYAAATISQCSWWRSCVLAQEMRPLCGVELQAQAASCQSHCCKQADVALLCSEKA